MNGKQAKLCRRIVKEGYGVPAQETTYEAGRYPRVLAAGCGRELYKREKQRRKMYKYKGTRTSKPLKD
ncbi:hypothetical protein P13BB106kb_p055 [Pectobacterium phage DU_PP_V]|uniref:Uncharacterized protein n=1 Tax=Pectobacterium phage DU_PP_V TaxID=2041492 RepID=A0A2D2W6W5_9CAUD|nr:hypothetical protein HOS40_gp114 [Pectobacterium phage DU_PP_V]ATS94039.1 hypothetical protein P13BB106kb_p055 [Pectobacterium phage DU_PP_V]